MKFSGDKTVEMLLFEAEIARGGKGSEGVAAEKHGRLHA